ncbi:MAG: hypothetical protein RIF41_07600 [Polyangiaceae bacterium]
MSHPLDRPAPRAQPRESNLRATVLREINTRPHGWAFATTGIAEGGIPDVVGSYRHRALALELKTATGRLSPRQRRHLRLAAAAGAEAHVVREVSELRAILDRIDKETE